MKSIANLWKGPWPYKEADGVGVLIAGLPDDEDYFVELMWSHGCHPTRGRAILDAIKRNGLFKGTISATLNFDEIARGITSLSMSLRIIPPLPIQFLRTSATYLRIENGGSEKTEIPLPAYKDRNPPRKSL